MGHHTPYDALELLKQTSEKHKLEAFFQTGAYICTEATDMTHVGQ